MPTSHCVIQYVLFPPNIQLKHRPKDHDYPSMVNLFKKKKDDERSSTSSIEEQQFEKRRKSVKANDSNCCCSQYTTEDNYQLITECWIEPQHGTVVVNKKQNNNYMAGLMYEELADAVSKYY